MKKNYFFKSAVFLAAILTVFACKKTAPPSPELTVSASIVNLSSGGGSQDITVTSNADWTLSNPALSWLTLSVTSGKSGSTVIHMTATSANSTGSTQSVILELSASNGQARRVTVNQAPMIYPSYNRSPIPADQTGMSSTASQIANNITYGWNFWDTLENYGSGFTTITQQQFDTLKANGINAVRIPVNYDRHLINKKTAQIDPAWLKQIHDIVQYGINDGMYVTINIHYDPGNTGDPNQRTQPTGAVQDTADARHGAYWEQIATAMRDFDEHLMFASLNETVGTDMPSILAVMRYHQTFVNAVRATGGKNVYRTLVIQSPSASTDILNQYLDPANANNTAKLPTDPTPHRMMLEFHYYTPSQFCILGGSQKPGTNYPNIDTAAADFDASWGKELYFWGNRNTYWDPVLKKYTSYHSTTPRYLNRNCTANTEEGYVDSIMNTVKARFADKGIPLFMGEYAPNYHAPRLRSSPADSVLDVRSSTHFIAYVAQQAKANGVIPYLWAGLFDRSQPGKEMDLLTLDSIKVAVNRGVAAYGKGGAHF